MKQILVFIFILTNITYAFSQKQDSLKNLDHFDIFPIDSTATVDSTLRIINLNPYFTLHVDSVLTYNLQINKEQSKYYWYLKNSPIGVKINKDNGLLYIKTDKTFFMTGRLKYDIEYKVQIGVQNLNNPKDKIDTTFTIVFYNTEITPSKVKPNVNGTLMAEEGDSISFQVQCEAGSFPIEHISQASNVTITNFKEVTKCGDFFQWMIPFDFIREGDTPKQKLLALQFIGNDKFFNRDTSVVKISVRQGVNYPMRYEENRLIVAEVSQYVRNLKMTFYVISKTIKNNKSTRTTFDISSSTTAMAGTILSSSDNSGTKNVGTVLPSVGLALIPVKEAVSPSKVQEQNTATQVRSVIKRLEFLISENQLLGKRDTDVLTKTKKLRDELKSAQLQLVDLPVELDQKYTDEQVDNYFKSNKVNKRYKLKAN